MSASERIFKYPLFVDPGHEAGGWGTIRMSKGARVLTVHAQGPQVMLWAIIDKRMPMVERRFVIVATGAQPPDLEYVYVGSAFVDDARWVWHVFLGAEPGEPR